MFQDKRNKVKGERKKNDLAKMEMTQVTELAKQVISNIELENVHTQLSILYMILSPVTWVIFAGGG